MLVFVNRGRLWFGCTEICWAYEAGERVGDIMCLEGEAGDS